MTDPTPAAAAAAPAAASTSASPSVGPVPYDRFAEVLGERNTYRANADKAAADVLAAQAERDKNAAELTALRSKMARLEARADLGIEDDDDADRVLAVYQRETADTKPEKRPKIKEWARSEEGLAKLPKSIRTAYGDVWTGTPAQGQPAAQPGRQSPPGQAPATNRGAAPAPATRPEAAIARRSPRRPG
jgi:hypothetical protein